MSDPIACPACQEVKAPALRIGTIAICGACGASLIVNGDGTIRRAVALDLDALMPGDRATLTKARSKLARPERKP
jgi:uncharacterized paraquat-inducible protein A